MFRILLGTMKNMFIIIMNALNKDKFSVMKPHILFISLFLYLINCFGQHRVDTVIYNGVYKSYFCYELKQPLYVTYALYKGGGNCSRSSYRFTDCNSSHTAKDEDYAGSGYDKGHLANAEDFAYNCEKDKKTFCYYNCLPQTVKLNRGIWKVWEGTIRDLSHTKRIFIVTGGIYKSKTIGPGKIGVPTYCYKIVINSRTKEIIYCLLFKNDDSNSVRQISLEELKGMLDYPLMPM